MVRKKWWLGVVTGILCLEGVAGCSASPETGKEAEAVECTCHALGVGETRSLDCFQETFADACPAYDAAIAMRACGEGETSGSVQQLGCAVSVRFFSNTDKSQSECVYDSVSHALVYAKREGEETCGQFSYDAGVRPTCAVAEQQASCSLCERRFDACVPYERDPAACTIEALCASGSTECVRFEDVARSDACSRNPIDLGTPSLSRGCGVTRIYSAGNYDSYDYQFDSSTHALLLSYHFDRNVYTNSYPPCKGLWGTLPDTCEDEENCTLCRSKDGACSAEQLADR